MLKRGPRPLPSSPAIVPETESISWKTSLVAAKNAFSPVLSPASGPPAPAGPPRTPGSRGPAKVAPAAWASADCDHAADPAIATPTSSQEWNTPAFVIFALHVFFRITKMRLPAAAAGIATNMLDNMLH